MCSYAVFKVPFTFFQADKLISNLWFGERITCMSSFTQCYSIPLQYLFYFAKSVTEYKVNINLLIEMNQILVTGQFV